jgi:hypothetical protein
MPECSYCGDSFESQQAHLEHLGAEHEGELGTIDQRRVSEELDGSEEEGLPTGPVVLGVVLAVSVALVGYVIFVHGSGGGQGTVNGIEVAQSPGAVAQSEHGHGYINVSVDGEEIDFSQQQYQRPGQYQAFHFEGGDGEVWHKHASSVTLEYAMATLGIEVTETTVSIDGTTYDDADPGTTVNVTVDGEPVDPATYELQGASESTPASGDYVRITVTTDG